jgi:hypothetical protein
MMLRRRVRGKAAVEAAQYEAALCRCPVSCTEAWRAASARRGISRVLAIFGRWSREPGLSAGLEPSSRRAAPGHCTLLAQ